MKKVLTITIANTLFTVEEDAYEKIKSYLDSIHTYFAAYPEEPEILNDIEARIAEQLLEKVTSPQNIVTLTHVEKVMEVMGSVEEIAGENTAGEKKEYSKEEAPRRLYRNPDDAVIAGVAGGLAVYLKIDPLVVRLVFVILTLISGGSLILIYIIMAFIIPKANTPADKIKMYGGPITLHSFKETIKESVENLKKNGKKVITPERRSEARSILERLIRLFGKIIVIFAKIIAIIVGISILLGAIAGLVAITYVFVHLLFSASFTFGDVAFTSSLGAGTIYYIFLGLSYIVAFIPLVFITVLGAFLISLKSNMRLKSAVLFIGIWFAALITLGLLFVEYLPHTPKQEPVQIYTLQV